MPSHWTSSAPLIIFSDPDFPTRRQALTEARQHRHDPGPVLEWFGAAIGNPINWGVLVHLCEALLCRQPTDPPVTLYLDHVAWPAAALSRLLHYSRRIGLRCVWGADPTTADWNHFFWLAGAGTHDWSARRGWWIPATVLGPEDCVWDTPPP